MDRNPDKADVWAQPLRKLGLTVHLTSLDVTSLEAVRSVKEEVENQFPPIGGVVQGAMVLSDGLFADMTLESLKRALRPKLDGSRNLSDIFSTQSLDFFIMFSSLTCVGGNSGQSNYTAANLVRIIFFL
jgi:hybrid polyketide synthase/nonribosomal peptide synthetase ACE1